MTLVRAVLVLSAVLAGVADAQQEDGRRIGVLVWHRSPNDLRALEGIRAALDLAGRPHELLVEEADSQEERAVAILGGFRERGVELVVAMGTEAALLCKEHERTLPVVFTAVTNPVESGIVPSWEGSGTNVAGNSNWVPPETVIALFRRAVPGLRRLGVLRSSETGVVSAAELRAMRRHLTQLRPGETPIEIDEVVVDSVDGLEAAVDRLAGDECQAIWIPIDFLVYENMDRVTRAAAARRMPLVSSSLRGANSGAVAGVLVDYEMLGERAALIALDILERGRNPGSIPVGTMQGYQVVVNLAAARRLGYDLPLPLLALADRLVDEDLQGDGR